MAEESIQTKAVVYDGAGDAHYDTISAFIKSMRGSDEKGAIYWLAKMLHAGEDFRFIARRIVIFASEDVGMADAEALPLAIATQQAVEFIGMPEARIPSLTPPSTCAARRRIARLRVVRGGERGDRNRENQAHAGKVKKQAFSRQSAVESSHCEVCLPARGDAELSASRLLGATRLQTPEHRNQEIDREQPDEDYLPESQVARRPMIGHHFRVSIEEPFPDAVDVDARHKNERQTDSEHDPQRQYRIAVGMDDVREKGSRRKDRRRLRGAQLSSYLCRPDARLFLERGPNHITAVDAGPPR